MFCLSMLGPEFIVMLALGQYVPARASVKAFHALDHKDWTSKHAFYADMGGIIFQPHDWKSFPINAAQLQYLVEKKYVDYPQIAKSEIDDKDKSDGLTRPVKDNYSPPAVTPTYISFLRVITSVQMVWFTLTVIARPPQNLVVTVLEITTIAYVFCTLWHIVLLEKETHGGLHEECASKQSHNPPDRPRWWPRRLETLRQHPSRVHRSPGVGGDTALEV